MEVETVYIQCFGSLTLKKNTEEGLKIINLKWRTAKSKELFSYLLHNRRVGVSKEKIIDLLWPNLNIEAAYSQLYSTIYSIRNLFKKSNLPIQIKSVNNTYELDIKFINIDVDRFKNLMSLDSIETEKCINQFNQALNIYQADYFHNEFYMWSYNKQEKLQILLLSKFTEATAYYERNNLIFESINLNIRMKEILPDLILPYKNLINLYKKIGYKKYMEQHMNELAELETKM